MAFGRLRRRLLTLTAVVLGTLLAVYAYHRLMPARFLVNARLAPSANGSRVLVVQEVIGSSLESRQSLRFDFIDPTSGARLHRTPAPFTLNSDRLRFLGGSVREWWGRDASVALIDVDSGQFVATDADIISKNPALRGELHRPNHGYTFAVDEAGSLRVEGGDGHDYAVDGTTLIASPLPSPARRLVQVPSAPDLRRVVSESEHFTTRQAAANATLPAGELVQACRTTTDGPCTLRLQQDDTIVWALGDAELDGNSVLSLEAEDARLAYVYAANDGVFGMLLGGVFLYAVELDTGRVAWKRKL